MRSRIAEISLLLALWHGPVLRAAAQCPTIAAGTVSGNVATTQLQEISGLVVSRQSPNVLWMHNDSGDTARVFAVRNTGALLGTFNFTGITAVDWEDIALGPGPTPGIDYLYVGDIGDNNAVRGAIRIYFVAEPFVDPGNPPGTVNLPGVQTITLTYPTGPKNAETLLCDPVTGDLFIITKRAQTSALIFRKAAPHSTETAVLEEVGTVTMDPVLSGGDISPSGDGILLRHETRIDYWPRLPGQTIPEALAGVSCANLPIRTESNGEAIGFFANGCGYYTSTEGLLPPIHSFVRMNCPATPTATSTPTPTSTAAPTQTATATPTASPSTSQTPTPTPSPSASPSLSPTPTASITPSVSETPSPTASPTATPSATNSVTLPNPARDWTFFG